MHPVIITDAVMEDYRKEKYPQRLAMALKRAPRNQKEISFLRKELQLIKK